MKYSVEPSNNNNFKFMITAEKAGHEIPICYINPIFQNDESLAFIIKEALQKSNKILNLTI